MLENERVHEHFRGDGVVHLPGFLSQSEIVELDENFARYIKEVVPTLPPADAFYEVDGDRRALKQMQRITDHDAYFDGLRRRPKFLQLAELLLEGPVRSEGVEWFNKPARIGKPTPPHQDGFYFCLKPDEALTIWIALDDVDEENGCVRYLRGSHREGVQQHGRSAVLGFSQTILDFEPRDGQRELVGIVRRGDALVHHSATIHWADANRSSRQRRACGLVYYSALAQRDEAAFARYLESSRSQQQALGAV
jgi:phytanoyl-CoA hydroxylase